MDVPPGGSAAMFDAIAPRYDRLNRILSLGRDTSWRRLAVSMLGAGPGDEILDVATGTADVAIAAAVRFPDARVLGVDPSGEMLRIGVEKVRRARLASRVRLEPADAMALPYPDGRFASAVVAFGVRNFPDRTRGLAEMRRVVRGGGRVVVLELTRPRFRPAAWYVNAVVPLLGAFLSQGPAYRYLRDSIEAFPPPEEFARTIEDAGLRLQGVFPLAFGAAHIFAAGRM